MLKLQPVDKPLFLALCAIAGALLLMWLFPPPCSSANPCEYEAAHQHESIAQREFASVHSAERTISYEYWLTIFTGGLVGVGILQILVLFRTDRTARLTARTAARQAVIARRQLAISGFQADILTAQKEIARKEFIASHRPKLKIRRIATIQPEAGHRQPASIDAANVGDSEATVVAIGVDIFPRIAGRPNTGAFVAVPIGRDPTEIIGVGQQATINVEGRTSLTAAQVDRILDGGAELCLLGIIQYIDGNDALRLTSFFRVYDRHTGRFMRAAADDEFSDWEYED